MSSIHIGAQFVKIPSPIGTNLRKIMDIVSVNKAEELEMAAIIYEFIAMNAHRFSSPILDAAIKLHDEIKKAEDEVEKR